MTRLADPATAFDAWRVIAWRLPILAMAIASPDARKASEITRMVAEKQRAFVLGLLNAQEAMARAWMIGAFDMQRVTADVVAAAEKPALDTLRGNVRRIRPHATAVSRRRRR